MTAIHFIHPDGSRQTCDGTIGQSVMHAAIAGGIPEIIAECGGNAMCATCHIYVDDGWAAKLPPMDDGEDALLDGTAADRKPNSRLSCQIKMTEELSGLEVTLPERQT